MSDNRPFAESCEQNKNPILDVLREQLTTPQRVLELSSGTGQHAVYFAKELPHLIWQPSDLPENLAGIQAWLDHAGSDNILPPVEIDVGEKEWNIEPVECAFSSNAVHIMSWNHVIALFSGLVSYTLPGALLIMYGPFNYNNEYTSQSNWEFDQYLRQRDPLSGIRDFEDIEELAKAAGFSLLKDYEMPANNRTLVWKKRAN
ncbi:MAG: DUF938 domain-containing protein [Pseudomonadota bacterium]